MIHRRFDCLLTSLWQFLFGNFSLAGIVSPLVASALLLLLLLFAQLVQSTDGIFESSKLATTDRELIEKVTHILCPFFDAVVFVGEYPFVLLGSNIGIRKRIKIAVLHGFDGFFLERYHLLELDFGCDHFHILLGEGFRLDGLAELIKGGQKIVLVFVYINVQVDLGWMDAVRKSKSSAFRSHSPNTVCMMVGG